jgi:amphi-Trp domain-containing protein
MFEKGAETMGKREVILFRSEEKQDRQSAVAFLHALVDKIAEGEVVLRQGDQEVAVSIPERIVLELKVEEEHKKNSVKMGLEIELEWVPGQEEAGGVSLG